MSEPVKKKIKVIEAKYVKEAECIAVLGECSEGRLVHQVHRSAFSFGNRTEAEIVKELEKTALMMVGKEITIVFDTELNDRLRNGVALKY